MSKPALVDYATSAEYKQHYESRYCREKIFTFDGIRVHFRKDNFEHSFYESSARDKKKDQFSEARAQRIDWIRMTLESSKAELYQGWDKDKKAYDGSRRVSVVYEDFVVVIRIKKKTDENGKPFAADFVTAYVADNSISKIKKSPKWSWAEKKK